jgi:FkbM family methyltransferase
MDGCRIALDESVPASLHHLLARDVFESHERNGIRKFLDRSLPVVELGGCIGVVACMTNRLLKEPARHVVVEANPELAPLLEANRNRNNCKFTTLQRAVGYDSDVVDLNIDDSNPLGSSALTSGGRTLRVATITLKEILRHFRFDRFTLICDIEGMEGELVRHESDILAKHVALIVIEVHRKLLGNNPVQEMLARLESIGFDTVSNTWDTYVLKNRRLAASTGRTS